MVGYLELNSNGEYILDFSPLISGEKKVLPFEIELNYQKPEIHKYADKDILSLVSKFKGKVEEKNEEYLLTFEADAELEVLCSRCAEETKHYVNQTFSLPLCGKKPERGTEEFECFQKGKINLTEITREFLLLELPSQYFCRKVCAGICPDCGSNLNYGVCECDNAEIDSRLRPLADFLLKMAKENENSYDDDDDDDDYYDDPDDEFRFDDDDDKL